MPKITGFLYGHYDSRGGAAFIEGTDKEQADAKYVEDFGLDQIFDDPEELTTAKNQVLEDDFLGLATVESPKEIQEGEDIDYRDDDLKLWVKNDGTTYELVVAAEQPEGFGESELGEDAFGVMVTRSKT
jgi:hypothetical protein